MIVLTGAAGFIGSCLLAKFHEEGLTDVLIADAFGDPEKEKNLRGKTCRARLDRLALPAWMDAHYRDISFVFHLGARTDTAETRTSLFDELNLHYSQRIWERCARYGIPLVYASSAATYGSGNQGFRDDHHLTPSLKPLNAYGESKQAFDRWVLRQKDQPPFWAGLKFFNVYGPNEYHKGRMASVVYHAHRQIRQSGSITLFRSHKPAFKDGEQLRDFIYVRDVVDVCIWMMTHTPLSGIYNLGSGQACSFNDLARSVFRAAGRPAKISYADMPTDIRNNYQYYTQAVMEKLRGAGYNKAFRSLEEGVAEYVGEYLSQSRYL